MNIWVQVFMWTYVFSSLSVKLLSHMVPSLTFCLNWRITALQSCINSAIQQHKNHPEVYIYALSLKPPSHLPLQVVTEH